MRSITVITTCVALALAKDQEQDFVDKLLDKLSNKLIDRALQYTDLDETTLGKTHPDVALGRPLSAMRARYIAPFAAKPPAPARNDILFQSCPARGTISTNAMPIDNMNPFYAKSQPQACTPKSTSVSAMQDSLRKHGRPFSPYEKIALTALAGKRDVSMAAQVKDVYNSMTRQQQAVIDGVTKAVIVRAAKAKAPAGPGVLNEMLRDESGPGAWGGPAKPEEMAGITAPLGFWDPLGKASEEKVDNKLLYYYREVELQHGRWGMMASAGFLVTETLGFRPFLGDKIQWIDGLNSHYNDVNHIKGNYFDSLIDGWWLALYVLIIAGEGSNPFWKDLDLNQLPGDLGFDPLGLKPTKPEALLEMQNKELNNGRLAMLAASGIIAQELVTGKPVVDIGSPLAGLKLG